MKMTRVAINGFGGIGRTVFCIWLRRPEVAIEIAAINDLMPIETAAVHGVMTADVRVIGNCIAIGDLMISYIQVKDPKEAPWRSIDIDVVIESTGRLTKREKASGHSFDVYVGRRP